MKTKKKDLTRVLDGLWDDAGVILIGLLALGGLIVIL